MLLMSNKAASQATSLRIDIKPTSTGIAGEITDKTTQKKLQVTCLRLDCESGEKFVVYEDKLNTVVVNGGGLYHETVLYQNDCAKVN